MKTVFIYALKDPSDGAVRYIGKTKNPMRRLYLHVLRSSKKQTHRDCWISCLAGFGQRPIIEILDEVPETQQNFFECAYIKAYREAGARLTNHTKGGDGGATTTGRKRPPGECEKIRLRLKGVPKSPEHRAALSAALIGRPQPAGKSSGTGRKPGFKHSEETKKLMSERAKGKYVGDKNPMFGRKHTEETLAKQRAAKNV